MENQEIIQIIKNLKGRRTYEEKKASKLGFTSFMHILKIKFLKRKKLRKIKKRLEKQKSKII